MYYVYILRSLETGRFYIGQTQDVEERFRLHGAGTVPATKGSVPWELVRVESFASRQEACAREREIKAKKSHRWIEWLIGQPIG